MISNITIQSLVMSNTGAPWCKVTTSSTPAVDGLIYTLDGSPWWGQRPWALNFLKKYSDGAWKPHLLKENVAGTWVAKDLNSYL